MRTNIQNSIKTSEKLKTRKDYLIAISKIISTTQTALTKTQKLSIEAINAELRYIDNKIKKTT